LITKQGQQEGIINVAQGSSYLVSTQHSRTAQELFSYPAAAKVFVLKSDEGEAHYILHTDGDPGDNFGNAPNGSFYLHLAVTNVSVFMKSGSFGANDGVWLGVGNGEIQAVTATADGLTTGQLTGGDQFISVTSANANNIISLPAIALVPTGGRIRGIVGANGFELRVIAAEATTSKINDVTTNVEAAIPADTSFTVLKISSTQWILTCVTKLGAVLTAIVPDAV
jgi:hypothetical protein